LKRSDLLMHMISTDKAIGRDSKNDHNIWWP
jgi:hypothetical protein